MKRVVWYSMVYGIINQICLYANTCSVMIPKSYASESLSLVLHLSDSQGNLFVGTCSLDGLPLTDSSELEHSVYIRKSDSLVHHVPDSAEINGDVDSDNQYVLHMEFQDDIKVLKILLVKENLLSDSTFEVLTVALKMHEGQLSDVSQESADQFDFIGDVNRADLEHVDKNSAFEQRMKHVLLYAKIAIIYQYMKFKHMVLNVCKK